MAFFLLLVLSVSSFFSPPTFITCCTTKYIVDKKERIEGGEGNMVVKQQTRNTDRFRLQSNRQE